MPHDHDAGGIVPRRPSPDPARPAETAAEIRPEARPGRAPSPAVRRPEITASGRYVHPETGAVEYWFVDPATGEARRLDAWTPTAIEGAYFLAPSALNQTARTAEVAEFQPTTVASDRATIRFTVSHFSGYMLSSGRTRTYYYR